MKACVRQSDVGTSSPLSTTFPSEGWGPVGTAEVTIRSAHHLRPLPGPQPSLGKQEEQKLRLRRFRLTLEAGIFSSLAASGRFNAPADHALYIPTEERFPAALFLMTDKNKKASSLGPRKFPVIGAEFPVNRKGRIAKMLILNI